MAKRNRVSRAICKGETFGWWTVIEPAIGVGTREKKPRAKVRCKCGREKTVQIYTLLKGTSTNCGCNKENHRYNGSKMTSTHLREYHVWKHMLKRCEDPSDPSYHLYGARSITVCARWKEDVRNFIADMGKMPEQPHTMLDRIDNNGNYTPENCRWATPKVQANNRRSNLRIKVGDECHTPPEWEEITGIPAFVIRDRFRRGWPEDRILTPHDTRYHKKDHEYLTDDSSLVDRP